ncbi:hypothetical protein AAG906_019152 [Vitis piasezkii]
MEHLLAPRDFFYPRIAMDFYQSMTTKEVRNPTLIHFTIDGRHEGVLLEALYKMSEGFFFGPHHLILAALLYFEEKVHKKKLQRADCIPLLFPRLLCQILEHMGYPAEPQLERKRICLDHLSSLGHCKENFPRHRHEDITVAIPAIPRAPPCPASRPSTSVEPRMAIPISNIESCAVLETLDFSSNLARRWHPSSMPRVDVGHTGSTSAILKQLQIHFDRHKSEPSTLLHEPHSRP